MEVKVIDNHNARRCAYHALLLQEQGAYANLAIKQAMNNALSDRDRAFATALFYTVLEHKMTLLYYIKNLAKKRIALPVRLVLLIGSAQMFYMDVPISAAVNESVKLCKQVGKIQSAGFVNALLRALYNQKQEDKLPKPEGNIVERWSIEYSYPTWLIERFLQLFDEAEVERLISLSGENRKICVCANPFKITPVEFDNLLNSRGIHYTAGDFVERARYIDLPNIANDSIFLEGLCLIQSESSMMVCQIADAKKHMKVLDACAAPGGKALQLAIQMGIGEITAWDNHPHRVDLIDRSSKRLGIDWVQTSCEDATKCKGNLLDSFDLVLLDVPCSGLGVIRAKPDLKYSKQQQHVDELVKLQAEILSKCSRYVKPGGILIYSTCTLLPEENQEQIECFLREHLEFKMDSIEFAFEDGFDKQRLLNGQVQLLPQRDGLDAFFIARMRRQPKGGF